MPAYYLPTIIKTFSTKLLWSLALPHIREEKVLELGAVQAEGWW